MKAGSLTIRWKHRHDHAPLMEHMTLCEISNENLPFNYEGRAYCHIKDHFCKDEGRKLSLARAMKNANLPKEERKVIWEIYRNTKVGGRW
jgi:hypothetical protein